MSEIKNDISGVAALADWLGDSGSPVNSVVAELRSERCVSGDNGKPCPLNRGQGWIETAKGEVANWVRAELTLKSGMNLHVSNENKLHVCRACSCFLPLKVWMPLKHLKEHTTQEVIDKTPSWCWVRNELEFTHEND